MNYFIFKHVNLIIPSEFILTEDTKFNPKGTHFVVCVQDKDLLLNLKKIYNDKGSVYILFKNGKPVDKNSYFYVRRFLSEYKYIECDLKKFDKIRSFL